MKTDQTCKLPLSTAGPQTRNDLGASRTGKLQASDSAVTIIGGGFAGCILAIRLLQRQQVDSITVIEPRADIGRGVAYSSHDPCHLLNGPTRMFSLDANDAGHFDDWLNRVDDKTLVSEPDSRDRYVSRWSFGTYVNEQLKLSIRAYPWTRFLHIRQRAHSVLPSDDGFVVQLEDGSRHSAQKVILATGVFKSAAETFEQTVVSNPSYVRDLWDPSKIEAIRDSRNVLLIGSSLSMVDAVASLESRGFKGNFTAVSRNGHLVEAWREAIEREDFLDDNDLPDSVLRLLQVVNKERRRIAREEGDWRSLLHSLKPRILRLWQSAPTNEKLLFARRLRSLWDVTIHQAAPPSRKWVEVARAQGRFVHRAGQIRRLCSDRVGLEAIIRWRGTNDDEALQFDAIVDCRGHQEHDWRKIGDTLIKNLLVSNIVTPHTTGFGIDASNQGAVKSTDGKFVDGLYAIGHPLRGVSWESSSVSEQICQANVLSEIINLTRR